jgi:hypothetical protein
MLTGALHASCTKEQHMDVTDEPGNIAVTFLQGKGKLSCIRLASGTL